jgi:hypothetical protein
VYMNRKVLFYGDFSTMLLGQAYQEMAGVQDQAIFQSQVVHQTEHESGLHIGATAELGAIAGYYASLPLGREGNMGWKAALLYEYEITPGAPVGAFEVMVYKPPQDDPNHLSRITDDNLSDAVHYAAELFGVTTLILLTLPFHQDYVTLDDLREWRATNDRIRNFGQTWTPAVNKSADDDYATVQTVLVLDFDALTAATIHGNAVAIGMTHTDTDDYLLKRLAKGTGLPAIAQVCGEPKDGETRLELCKKNMIASDGMYYCMETIGHRVAAGISCLMQCSAASSASSSSSPNQKQQQSGCEQDCNTQFMSLTPVDASKYTVEP